MIIISKIFLVIALITILVMVFFGQSNEKILDVCVKGIAASCVLAGLSGLIVSW